jgi:hypothetical protein
MKGTEEMVCIEENECRRDRKNKKILVTRRKRIYQTLGKTDRNCDITFK